MEFFSCASRDVRLAHKRPAAKSGEKPPAAGGPTFLGALLVALLLAACGSADEPAVAPLTSDPHVAASEVTTSTDEPSSESEWAEEEVTFPFGPDHLFGVVTRPPGPAPHPAIVLLSGSGGTDGVRSDSTEPVFVDHARRLAAEGFVVLRYDPPGVGRSGGGAVIPSLDVRAEETHAAIQYLKSQPDVAEDRVGLQGWSQGPWVMAMTAMRYPEDVAFLVSVVGSGQSVANQQVYGIQAQSEAAGLSAVDVAKAVAFGRLLVDWQLPEPIFAAQYDASSAALGPGPWTQFAELVYQPDGIGLVEGLEEGVEILRSVQGEPWTAALYLDLYLARFESLPSDLAEEDVVGLQHVMAENLTTDPKDFLTEVRAPVLAFFGEDDLNVDSRVSPALFERYLAEAGNENFMVVVIPDVGHNIGLSTSGYWDTLSAWLNGLFE